MFSAVGGFYGFLAVIEIVTILVFLSAVGLLPDRAFSLGRRHAVIFGAVWVAALTFEYWAFGPWSFVQINDEGELSIPLLIYRAAIHAGGQYAHGVAGGADLLSMAAYNNGFVTLERIFFEILPPWAAIGANKVLAIGVSFAGAYLLARRWGKADRFSAVGLAAFHTLAHRYMLGATLYQGLAYQLIPLAVYLLVFRLDRRFFFAGAFAVSVMHALSTAPMHAAPAVGFAVGLAWLLRGCVRPMRFVAGLLLLVGVAVANWFEVVFAFLQTAEFTSLAKREVIPEAGNILLQFTKYFTDRSVETLILILVFLGWLAARRSSRFGMSAAVLVVAWLSGPLLLIVPWRDLGLDLFGGYDFFYISLALPAMVVLVGGWATRTGGSIEAWPRRTRWLTPAAVVFAIALGQAAYQKTFNFAQWIWFGGQTVYGGYSVLSERAWAPEHAFRVVTVPYRLFPNITSAYGLESFDGFVTNHPEGRSLYWRYGVCGDRQGCAWRLQTYVSGDPLADFQCCRRYDANRVFHDLDAFRVGNVEYIVSLLPIDGPGLVHVAGPPPDTVPPRRGDPLFQRLRDLLGLLARPENPHVYRLSGALPRAFVATDVAVLGGAVSDAEKVRRVIEKSLQRGVMVLRKDRAVLPDPREGRVLAVDVIPDGYRVHVDMPDGGILVVNAPWLPFWSATADGGPVSSVAANLIHMAVSVPANASIIELKYHRPTAVEKITR